MYELPAHIRALMDELDAAKTAHRVEQRAASLAVKPQRDALNKLKKKLSAAQDRRQGLLDKGRRVLMFDPSDEAVLQCVRSIWRNEWAEVEARIESLKSQLVTAECALLIQQGQP